MTTATSYQTRFREQVSEEYAGSIPIVPELDAKRFMSTLGSRVQEYVAATGVKRFALGLSGDKDSAVVAAALASLDMGIDVIGVHVSMQENGGGEPLERVCELQRKFPRVHLHVLEGYNAWQKHVEQVNFTDADNAYTTSLHQHVITMVIEKIRTERESTVIAGGLNRTEYLAGAFPKDMFVDFLPIVGLYKTWICDLADNLDLPYNIRRRTPPFQRYTGDAAEVDMSSRGHPLIDDIWAKAKEFKDGTPGLPLRLHLLLDALYYKIEHEGSTLGTLEEQYPILAREINIVRSLMKHFSYKIVPRQNSPLRWKHTDPWQNTEGTQPVHILDKEPEFQELKRIYLR